VPLFGRVLDSLFGRQVGILGAAGDVAANLLRLFANLFQFLDEIISRSTSISKSFWRGPQVMIFMISACRRLEHHSTRQSKGLTRLHAAFSP
jgi:hypothetical protein